MSSRDIIESNLIRLRERIRAACHRAGRSPEAVKLVAVTKYADPSWVRDLISLGQLELAESRPQQLSQRAAELPDNVNWHLIGHLQRNKVELVLPVANLIHSVDSLRLLEKIDQEALKRSLRPRVLLEVNVSGEAAKDGFNADELRTHVAKLTGFATLRIEGVMTMAPQAEDPEYARPVFRALKDFRDELTTLSDGKLNIPQLSMGMSNDFEVAIEEGATLIRIGSSLFAGLEDPS